MRQSDGSLMARISDQVPVRGVEDGEAASVGAAHQPASCHGHAGDVAGQALQHHLLAAVIPLLAQGTQVHAACVARYT